jgi:predicted AAA+ superfamily ATPase
VRRGLTAFPPRTLLFFDEVQESPDLVRWLRFFKEDHPELAVVAAGSHMEVRLKRRGFSFPVGRVTFEALRPFTLFEFMRARCAGALVEEIQGSLAERRPLPPALHDDSLALLREYFLVGGLPEAVATWCRTLDPVAVRRVHADLLEAYAEDLQKYRGQRSAEALAAAFDHLPRHYGTRFTYEGFAPGQGSLAMRRALDLFEAALLVTRVRPTSSVGLPLVARPRSAPKLLPVDVGLALHAAGLGAEDLRGEAVEGVLDGRAAEMFVGQQLLAAHRLPRERLHFWVAASAQANAEVDFLVPLAGRPCPIEVKSSAAGSLRSLHWFLHRAGLGVACRCWARAYEEARHEVQLPAGPRLRYRLVSLPLYAIEGLHACPALDEDQAGAA